jgi:hypothetical protein
MRFSERVIGINNKILLISALKEISLGSNITI